MTFFRDFRRGDDSFLPYGGFNKVCANNIDRLGVVWGQFYVGNGVSSSFLDGMLGSRGPVLGPPGRPSHVSGWRPGENVSNLLELEAL